MTAAAPGTRGLVRALWVQVRAEHGVILLGATTLLVLARYHGSTGFFRKQLAFLFAGHPAKAALPYFWWFGCAVVFYGLLPLLLSRWTKGSFRERYGLGLGDVRFGLAGLALLLALMLPVVYAVSHTRTFAAHYPLGGRGAYELLLPDGKTLVKSLPLFLAYEAGYVLYFVAWEFFYRGWMLFGLLGRFGAGAAIVLQTVPFALLHLGKPEPEALGSIVAGLALGVLALRARSFWYGAIVHAAVAVTMDALAVVPYLLRP